MCLYQEIATDTPCQLLKGSVQTCFSVSCCPGLFALKIFIYLYYILEFFCESRSEVFSSESVKVKVTQSCLTLSDPMNYVVHGIL